MTLGDWVAKNATYVADVRRDWYSDGELIAKAGQAMVVADEVTYRPQATRRCRSYGPFGYCTCSSCGMGIDTSDSYCRHCGASFGATEYERVRD